MNQHPHQANNVDSAEYPPEPASPSNVHSAHGDHGHRDMGDGGHGHDGHMDHSGHESLFQRLFWVSLILSIPVVFYSDMVQHWFGYAAPAFPGSAWVSPVLGTVVFLYGGRVFLQGGWAEAKARQPGMMLLISLAIVVAFLASAATTFGYLHLDFWWELVLLVTIMLLGHWLEMRALGETQNALQALADLVPDDAERITDGGIERVPVAALQVGDLVLVRPGASVPADGVIDQGSAEFDESMITGESKPVAHGPGDRIVAGTVLAGSSVRFTVSDLGDDTVLGGIQKLVADAQSSRSRAQALADRFAAWLFYIATGAAAITFLVWWLVVGSLNEAITRTVTLLVISCPHALGLAIPLVIAITTEVGARSGVLIKDRLALERMRTITTVLFDKTGTLTRGAHELRDVSATNGDNDAFLAKVAAVEGDSEHPLARAIVTAAETRGLEIPRAEGFAAIPGRGVEAMIEGEEIAVGGPRILEERGVSIPAALVAWQAQQEAHGSAVLYALHGDDVIGGLALADAIRPESAEAVRDLSDAGVDVVMITGDAQNVADAVAADLGIKTMYAQVAPEDKQQVVDELKRAGRSVAMVGDGVNDAPALSAADVGLAIGAGTDVAIQSAGIVLASDDPRTVAGVRRLSAASYRKMIQNLAWAAGYNVLAIPLAAGVLAPIGINPSPAVAAIAMSLSTIVVALNAQTLRRFQLLPAA